MKKNDEIIGIISAYGSNGEGIIKHDDNVVFVPFTVIGEKVLVKILKVSSKCAFGKLLEVLEPSTERVETICPVYSRCGGCQIQHLRYDSQLKLKEENIKRCFQKVAGLEVDIVPTIKSPKEFGYRNKLQLPVAETKNGTEIGFYAENSHRVVGINDCPINPSWTKDIILSFKKYLSEFNLKGYNYETNSGYIREIVVKQVLDKLIITFVSTTKKRTGIDRLIDILKENLAYEFSLYQNVNNSTSNVIFGDEFYLLYGAPEYEAEMQNIKYPIGVRSFMQVNTEVCKMLYQSVVDFIDADEDTVVLDAYSGAGLMTALLSRKAKKAIGVEIIKEATVLADDLKVKNGLSDKITNYNGKCEEIMPDIIEKEKEKSSKIRVVLDPPRKGCDIKVLDSILKCDIDKIVYVSCLPQSLARDIGILIGSLKYENGELKRVENYTPKYRIETITPFDMFPQTKHIETVVCLSKI